MKKQLSCIIIALIMQLSAVATPISGTFSIPGDYSSISAAIADINTNGIGS